MKIRKLINRASIWVCALIFGIVFPNMQTNAKNLPSLLINGRSSEGISFLNNKKSLTLQVPELAENGTSDVITSFWNVANHITPLDPVLRACVSTTNVSRGNLLTTTVSGNNTASGFTTQFVLLDASNIIVVGPQASGTFLTPITPGVYKIVAVNYSGTVSGLNVGQNISGITGACWELSAPKCFNVQNPTCVSLTSVVLGNTLTATISGNNTALTTRYVLTDGNNIILQGPSVNPTFTPTSTGNYSIYSINYDGTVSGLTVGNNFLTQVGTSTECFSKSSPKCFSVTCWTITSAVTSPSVCGGTNGSIKICGLPANSSGYTVSYSKNGIASSLTNQTTDANGCVTITNLGSGSYTDIKVSNSGCAGSNILTATLVDPSAPSAPTGLTSTATVCAGGSVSLSANGTIGASYTWTVSPNTGASLSSSSGVVSGTSVTNSLNTSSQGTYTVNLTQTVAGCTSPAVGAVVTVNGSSSAPAIVGTSSVSNTCPSITVDLTTKQPGAVSGQTYEWHTVATNPTAGTLVAMPATVGAAGTYYLYLKSSNLKIVV
jgi:hypothetical protein